MISQLIGFLHSLALEYGIAGLFLAEVIEEIVVPIPSAVVMMSGGFLFLGGEPLSFFAFQKLILEVALPLALGLTLGSLFAYAILYYLGRPAIDRYGKYLGVSWEDVERVQKYFDKSNKDEVFFLLARTVPLVPNVAINAFCGLTRMPIKKYISLTFIGGLLRGILLGFAGWQAGSVYITYAEAIDRGEKIVLAGLVLLCIGFVCYLWKRKKRSRS